MGEFEESGHVTVEQGGFVATSNHQSAEEIKAALALGEEKPAEDPDEKVSQAASELGKKGGEASAKAKAEKAEEAKPEAKVEEKPAENPRHDARARVMQATREAAEAKREAAALKAELEKMRTAPAKPAGEGKPARDPSVKPTLDQFDGETAYEDFMEALMEWKTDQTLTKAEQEREQREHSERYAAAVTQYMGNFKQKVDKDREVLFAQADPDLLEAKPTFMLQPGTTPGPENAIADEIMTSERPTELILYLSQNQDEVNRLMSLPTSYAIARAVGAIEAKLPANGESKTEPEKRAPAPTSKAAPPIRPVTGAAAVSDQPPADDAPYEEHERYWNAQDAKRRAAR